jgi:hypothetical protein
MLLLWTLNGKPLFPLGFGNKFRQLRGREKELCNEIGIFGGLTSERPVSSFTFVPFKDVAESETKHVETRPAVHAGRVGGFPLKSSRLWLACIANISGVICSHDCMIVSDLQ